MPPKTKFLISQSFINDAFVTQSDFPKEMIKPQYCPRYLMYKYVEGLKTEPTTAMQLGNYFEWHLLGATRDGIEPLIPQIGIKDLRPTKSATKATMCEYLTSKKVVFSENAKAHELFEHICKLPPDMTAGTPSAPQLKVDMVVSIAKKVLKEMGLDTENGEKQVKVCTKKKSGHLDWVTNDLQEPARKCIIDVKYTQTQQDDWRNGWGDISTKEEAKIQASHYASIYFEKYGEWVPFYFFIFGESGWIKIIQMVMTEQGLAMYNVAVQQAEELLQKFVATNWKARPEFNRCLSCPFYEICPEKALLPTIEEFSL